MEIPKNGWFLKGQFQSNMDDGTVTHISGNLHMAMYCNSRQPIQGFMFFVSTSQILTPYMDQIR